MTDSDHAFSESLLSPVTFADRLGGIEELSTLVGWVVARTSAGEVFDVEELRAALWRVGEKWRLLAGRVEAVPVSASDVGERPI